MATARRDGFGSLLKRRVTDVKTSVTTQVLAAVDVVKNEVVDARSEARSELAVVVSAGLTEFANVRQEVLQAVEQAASGGGISLGRYNQSFEAAPVWVVNHNLGRPVTLYVRGAAGQEIVAEVVYVSNVQARVFFDVPTAGSVSVI
jgi:hypothetical protein